MVNKGVEVVRDRVSITLPKECVTWIDQKVESRIYANRSHGIELLILEAMRQEKKEMNKNESNENWPEQKRHDPEHPGESNDSSR